MFTMSSSEDQSDSSMSHQRRTQPTCSQNHSPHPDMSNCCSSLASESTIRNYTSKEEGVWTGWQISSKEEGVRTGRMAEGFRNGSSEHE